MKVKVHFYDGGYCTHPEFVAIQGGSHKSVQFAALCAVIIHPILGPILYDTGYSERFFEVTKKMPYRIYAAVTPVYVKDEDKISHKIQNLKLHHTDFKYVILSHFHADHIGAVKDFEKSTYIYSESSFEWVENQTGFKALKKGYLPDLLPSDFKQRSLVIDETYIVQEKHFLHAYFDKIYDVFKDGSIIGVELPGHVKGQMGIYFQTEEQKFFLIADACYFSETFVDLVFPNALVNLINDDPTAYKDTIERIHNLHTERKDIEIIPSHCKEKFKKYARDCRWKSE